MERRFYRITKAGRSALRDEAARLSAYVETARARNLV
jgi:hypothetical protein